MPSPHVSEPKPVLPDGPQTLGSFRLCHTQHRTLSLFCSAHSGDGVSGDRSGIEESSCLLLLCNMICWSCVPWACRGIRKCTCCYMWGALVPGRHHATLLDSYVGSLNASFSNTLQLLTSLQQLHLGCTCIISPEHPGCTCIIFPEDLGCTCIISPEHLGCTYIISPEHLGCTCIISPEDLQDPGVLSCLNPQPPGSPGPLPGSNSHLNTFWWFGAYDILAALQFIAWLPSCYYSSWGITWSPLSGLSDLRHH
jgi:hypothetical protein